jgi:signal transduction histidine kinase
MVGPRPLSWGNGYPSRTPSSPETVMLPATPLSAVAHEDRAMVFTVAPWREWCDTMWKSLINILPRGNTLSEADWQRRHRLLQWVLLVHVPVLAAIGLALHNPLLPLAIALTIPVICAVAGRLLSHHRRLGSAAVSAGLVWCSTALVGITNGSIESHFHFFIIIGFIALYQDWVPFLLNVLFTVITHGVGSMWLRTLMFNHPAAQAHPWLWSLIHGVAVLLACVGVMLFWRVTEDEQNQKDDLTRKLADAEIGRRKFTSDMLVNLARRNQSMLYRQLEIINQLEESERNPDALAELFRLDHLTTRVRRNAENLLVLSGEKPPRVWSQPVELRDVVRAAIAETEDLDRVAFEVPEGPLVDGASVTDLTHLLAELTENAVRFSPPDMAVTIRGRRDPRGGRGQLLTVEDWGVGIDEADLAAANALLADPPEVDLAVSKRLGFHVVARLAKRHGIRVVLSPTPGSGITASIALPGSMFELGPEPVGALVPAGATAAARPGRPVPRRRPDQPVPELPAARTGTWAEHATAERTGLERTGSERTDVDRAAFERAAFDRAAFDRAGIRPAAPGRGGSERVESDTAAFERAPVDDGADVRSLIPGPRMPLPAETEGLAAGKPPERGAPSWTGWWAGTDPNRPGPAGADGTTATIETPAGSAEPADDGAPDDDAPAAARPSLRRRVPQAHLAPGLRIVPPGAEPVDPAPLPVAAEALSRYQASRAAARSAVDGQVANEAADERSAR